MEKNQVVEITIEDIGEDGEGIGRFEGYPLFVKGAVVGDVVRAKVLKAKKNYGYARVEELLRPSPDRVKPRCAAAGKCGGCQLQQLSYERQLWYKQNKVANCLQRIGGLSKEQLTACMEPILGMDEPYRYRNKAQYPVGVGRDGNPVMGFYAGHSHTIIPQEDCVLQEPVNAPLLAVLRGFFAKYRIPAYDEERGTGTVRHVLTRVGETTGEVMVCLVLNAGTEELAWWLKGDEVQGELVPRLKKTAEDVSARRPDAASENGGEGTGYVLRSVCVNVNTARTNVILGEKVYPVYGEPYITDRLGGISYRISPLSFYQVNPKQTAVLYAKALEYAGLSGRETVWDLYCGIGTISLFLAQRARQVYGVEIVPQAIDDARRNAEQNRISNVEFFVGAAEEIMPQKYRESGGSMRADVVVVDPPRKGCAESLLATMAVMQPERVVYVSCDPATLARDVKWLGEKGYEVKKVCPVDQFPQTGHVESIALLERVSS